MVNKIVDDKSGLFSVLSLFFGEDMLFLKFIKVLVIFGKVLRGIIGSSP